jgi:phage shock protein A
VSQQEYETTADYLEPLREQVEKAKKDVEREFGLVKHDISEIEYTLEHNPRVNTSQGATVLVREDDLELQHIDTEDVIDTEGTELQETIDELQAYSNQLEMEYAVYQTVLDVIESLDESLPKDKQDRLETLQNLGDKVAEMPNKVRTEVVRDYCDEVEGYRFGEEEEEYRYQMFEEFNGAFPVLKGAARSVELIESDMTDIALQ